MSKGFRHLGIALQADCTTNLPKLITIIGIPKIEKFKDNKNINFYVVTRPKDQFTVDKQIALIEEKILTIEEAVI